MKLKPGAITDIPWDDLSTPAKGPDPLQLRIESERQIVIIPPGEVPPVEVSNGLS
jgi:hypothetical protein